MPNLSEYLKKNMTEVISNLESRVKHWIPGLPIRTYNSEPEELNMPIVSTQPTEIFGDTFRKLLTNDTENMAYNTALPELSTEPFNNIVSTENTDLCSYAALGGLLAVPIIIAIIITCRIFLKETHKKESEDSYSNVESANNLNEAERGLLPIGSSTPKTDAEKQQLNFMLAESENPDIRKKANISHHQFYTLLPASNSSFHEKENDYDAPRFSKR